MKTYPAPSNSSHCLARRLKGLLVTAGAFLLLSYGSAFGQTTYTWNSADTTGNWSTPADWTNNSGYPGSTAGGSTTSNTDIANLNGLTTTTTITYDASTSGYLGSLYMGSGSTANTFLELANSLTINGGGSIYDGAGNGTTTGLEQLQLENNNLDIASGATFTIGSTNTSTTLVSASTLAAITNAATGTTATTGTGAVTIDGTLIMGNGSTGGYTAAIVAPVTLDSNATINIDDAASGTPTDRLVIQGNFTSTGTGATIKATGVGVAGSSMFFEGASTTIGSGTTISGFTASPAFTFADPGNTSTTQTISLGVLLPGQTDLRNSNGAIGTSTTELTMTKQISSTATSSNTLFGNAINTILLQDKNTYVNMIFQLGSNLNFNNGQSNGPVLLSSYGTTVGDEATIDLNGYTYNMTTGSTSAFAPSGVTPGTNSIILADTGYNSLTNTGTGTFEAAAFTFNSTGQDIAVNAGVVLDATTAADANNLGTYTNGVTTISPNSTFEYTGSGTATLSSNRAIGRLAVAAGGDLQIATAGLAVGGDITLSGSTATLDLNGQNVTESAGTGGISGGLNGSGVVLNSLASSTSTLTVNTANGNGSFSGVIENNSGSGGTIALTKAGTGTQTLSGANTYSGATNVNAGTLALATGGSLGSTTPVTVAAGATFGTASTNALPMNVFSLTSTAALTLNLGTSPATQSDLQLNLYSAGNNDLINAGTLTLNNTGTGNTFLLTLDNPTSATLSGSYTLLSWTSGSLALNQVTLAPGDPSGALSLGTNDLIFTATAAPEPSTWVLLLGGLVSLVVWRRRRDGFSA